MGRGYLGIDESNNGRYPEIFVGVYSENPEDIVTTTKGLSKKRKSPKRIINSILQEREFKYIVIDESYSQLFHTKNISVLAAAELIRAFNNLERIIIDGEIRRTELRNLEGLAQKPVIILPEPKADVKYPIVNAADNLAHILYKYHSECKRKNNDGKDYEEHLITPNIYEYSCLFLGQCDKKKNKNDKDKISGFRKNKNLIFTACS
ncbi:hypothetical protein JW756_00970 [Candidatus Woesearchaeota archaeon]|nr:hypothetical protein [Candidatus Woesearchaeota archaeon]